MSPQPDEEPSAEELRIAKFKLAMSELGLDYRKHYLLIASSILNSPETWRINWIRPITDEQFEKGQNLVDSIMNEI